MFPFAMFYPRVTAAVINILWANFVRFDDKISGASVARVESRGKTFYMVRGVKGLLSWSNDYTLGAFR